MKRRTPGGDLNQAAARVVAAATGDEPQKNPHAVALGRLGGEARREQLTAERRREIARQANAARVRAFRARKKEEAS